MVLTRPDTLRIDLPLESLAALCRQFDVVALWVFGSALRDDFTDASDVDFLARFRDDDAGPWMGKLQGFEEALTTLLRRRVEVVNRRGVERSTNPHRRQHILDSARLVYEAGA